MAQLNTDIVYKYRNTTKDGLFDENTKKLLEIGELFFSKPMFFEDPKDCYVDTFMDASDDDIRRYFLTELLPFMKPKDKLDFISSWWKKPQEYANQVFNYLQ